MRGIKFQIPNLYGKYLGDIFNNVDIKQYTWKVDEDDILLDDRDFLFLMDTLNGDELKRIISEQPYYIMFLNLKGYKDYNNLCEIDSYEQFIKSSYEILLFITDSIFVQIYSKDYNTINQIKKNAEINNFIDIQYLTETNDCRIEFTAK